MSPRYLMQSVYLTISYNLRSAIKGGKEKQLLNVEPDNIYTVDGDVSLKHWRVQGVDRL